MPALRQPVVPDSRWVKNGPSGVVIQDADWNRQRALGIAGMRIVLRPDGEPIFTRNGRLFSNATHPSPDEIEDVAILATRVMGFYPVTIEHLRGWPLDVLAMLWRFDLARPEPLDCRYWYDVVGGQLLRFRITAGVATS